MRAQGLPVVVPTYSEAEVAVAKRAVAAHRPAACGIRKGGPPSNGLQLACLVRSQRGRDGKIRCSYGGYPLLMACGETVGFAQEYEDYLKDPDPSRTERERYADPAGTSKGALEIVNGDRYDNLCSPFASPVGTREC